MSCTGPSMKNTETSAPNSSEPPISGRAYQVSTNLYLVVGASACSEPGTQYISKPRPNNPREQCLAETIVLGPINVAVQTAPMKTSPKPTPIDPTASQL